MHHTLDFTFIVFFRGFFSPGVGARTLLVTFFPPRENKRYFMFFDALNSNINFENLEIAAHLRNTKNAINVFNGALDVDVSTAIPPLKTLAIVDGGCP